MLLIYLVYDENKLMELYGNWLMSISSKKRKKKKSEINSSETPNVLGFWPKVYALAIKKTNMK